MANQKAVNIWSSTSICRVISGQLTPNYCRMHKFGPTICACGPRIIAGMHISQICINKAPFGNNMVRSLLRALLKSLQKSLQTNDMNIGGPRGPCSYRSYLHRYRIFDHAIGRSVQLLAGNNWVLGRSILRRFSMVVVTDGRMIVPTIPPLSQLFPLAHERA